MSSTLAPPRTAAANQARQRSAAAATARVHTALGQIRKERGTVTFAAVARRAGVSRTFLYTNPEVRQAVTAALTTEARPQQSADRHEPNGASWRERALNAEDALKHANAEILKQRHQIGELMGHMRDLQAEGGEQTLQRVTTENITLKQRVRQLTADNRALEERLQAARSTLRFQDRRLADLETRLIESQMEPNAAH